MDKINYAFDDEVVTRFRYDIDNRKIEIDFKGYFNFSENEYQEKPVSWIIERWSDAKSKLSSETNTVTLDKHIGVISMVLFSELKDGNLNLTVNMLDGRYIDLMFEKPFLELIEYKE